MGVVNIKNPSNEVVNEIRNWLINKGYEPGHIFVVNYVYVNVSSKISKEDLIEFKNLFKSDLTLSGVSYNQYGRLTEVEYHCFHPALEKYEVMLVDWLCDNDFPSAFFTLNRGISLTCSEKLSKEQISSFEREFEVTCRKFELSCNSDNICYTFS